MDKLVDQAECIYDRASIDAALDTIATEITQQLSEHKPLVLCVLHGGLIFTGHLLTRLSFPLQQDYIHASRYGGLTAGEGLKWLAPPHESLQDRTVLLLDDIFDQGHTLQAIRDYCLASGARAVYSAVLLIKNHTREKSDMRPDFVGLEVDDRYVFGFGMDYECLWRNANGIYAISPAAEEETTGG